MHKELMREVKFGKGIARVTVKMFNPTVDLDGDRYMSDRVKTTKQIDIIVGGKVYDSDFHATILKDDIISRDLMVKAKLDLTKKYTRVGKAITEGAEAHEAINSAIEEMKVELAAEFGVKTEKEIEQQKEIDAAKEIVASAEKEGVSNLLSAEDLKAWRKRYNDIHNEGGEGYIPHRVSRERYAAAVELLNKHEGGNPDEG